MDSEWEPPNKRRKLNHGNSKRKRKKYVHTKQKKRKRSIRNRNRDNMESDDSGIEILWDDNEYFPSSTRNNASNKNKKQNNQNTKNRKNGEKTKGQKQSRLNFKPMCCAVTNISNLDALVCGYYRSFLSDPLNKIKISMDIAKIIFEYQKNIMYIKINYMWTHRHNCCPSYKNCKIIKKNRGQYVFERDPFNLFDENAIKISTKFGKQVGHIPRDIAKSLAPLMDIGKIDLHSVGGVKGKPCLETVEIVPLQFLTKEEKESFQEYLEVVPYDENRYLFSN